MALVLALVALVLAFCGPRLLRHLTTRHAERSGVHHQAGSKLCCSDAPHDAAGERSDASLDLADVRGSRGLELADDFDGETLVGVLMDPHLEMAGDDER